MSKTVSFKKGEVPQKWYVVDVSDLILGRTATRIATILRGKHKPQFTPHIDTGDFVVVINAEKIRLTGKKRFTKKYYRHSGRIGNLKVETADQVQKKNPENLLRWAVWGMLPHNSLGRQLIKKLKVYPGPDHPHKAQQPEVLNMSVPG